MVMVAQTVRSYKHTHTRTYARTLSRQYKINLYLYNEVAITLIYEPFHLNRKRDHAEIIAINGLTGIISAPEYY